MHDPLKEGLEAEWKQIIMLLNNSENVRLANTKYAPNISVSSTHTTHLSSEL